MGKNRIKRIVSNLKHEIDDVLDSVYSDACACSCCGISKKRRSLVDISIIGLAKRDIKRAFSRDYIREHPKTYEVKAYAPIENLYEYGARDFLLKLLSDDKYIKVHDRIQQQFAKNAKPKGE